VSVRKDLDALLARAQQQGAEVTFTKNSHRRVSFNGHTTVVSVTPSHGGALIKARRDLKRMGLDV
jgi:hypothetical protein